jgi:hypothetical protein
MGGTHWQVQSRGRVVDVTESRLRAMLQARELTGLELARCEGVVEWQPLWSTTLFRDEVPTTLQDSPTTAVVRALQPFAVHLALYFLVCTLFHWRLPIPHALDTWSLLVAFQGIWTGWRCWPGVLARLGRSDASRLIGAEGDPKVVPLLHIPDDDPLPKLLRENLDGLRQASEDPSILTDLEDFRGALMSMHARRLELARLSSRDVLGRIEAEEQEARAKVASATDPKVAEEWEAAARALGERLATCRSAAQVAERLEVREHTLVHQLESLRLAAFHARLNAEEMPDFGQKIKGLRHQARANEEVDDALRRARRSLAVGQRG